MQIIHINRGGSVYRFKGWKFEVHPHIGPWPLKADGDPKLRAGPKFWEMWEEFSALSDKEKEAYKE